MALAVRRAELIARAMKLLNEVGPEGMTMRGLGQAAGMRAPSLYKHFAGKSELERELAAAGWAVLACLFSACGAGDPLIGQGWRGQDVRRRALRPPLGSARQPNPDHVDRPRPLARRLLLHRARPQAAEGRQQPLGARGQRAPRDGEPL